VRAGRLASATAAALSWAAMRLEVEASIPFARELVWAAYRDRLPELTRYLPNVRRIEQQSRRDDGPRTHLVNLWDGGGEIPSVARSFVSEALLTWTDFADWDQSDWSCRWRMRTHVFEEAIHATGVNRYFDLGGTTRLTIEGEIAVDPARLVGVPRLLAGPAARAAERVIVGRVRPNLVQVARGVGELLRDSTAR
jgi:hypothetical protein